VLKASLLIAGINELIDRFQSLDDLNPEAGDGHTSYRKRMAYLACLVKLRRWRISFRRWVPSLSSMSGLDPHFYFLAEPDDVPAINKQLTVQWMRDYQLS
jgi:hypothetical protein